MDRRTLVNPVATMTVIVGALNYGFWLAEALDLGGNALSGEVRDGHYFVANKGHYVEVAPEVWEHSRVHTLSIFVTQPFMLISLGYLVWTAARRHRKPGA